MSSQVLKMSLIVNSWTAVVTLSVRLYYTHL